MGKNKFALTVCFSAVLGLAANLADAGTTRSGGGHNGFNGSRNFGGRGGAGSHNLGGSHSFEHAGAHGTISHTGNLTNHTHSGTTTITTQKATVTYTGSMVVNARDSYQHQNTSTVTTKEGNQAYSGKTTFTEATDLRVFTHSGSLNMTKKGIAHDGAVAIKATRTERTVNHKGTVTSSRLVHDGATSIDRYSDNPSFNHSGTTHLEGNDGSMLYHTGKASANLDGDGVKEHSGYIEHSINGVVTDSREGFIEAYNGIMVSDTTLLLTGEDGKSLYHAKDRWIWPEGKNWDITSHTELSQYGVVTAAYDRSTWKGMVGVTDETGIVDMHDQWTRNSTLMLTGKEGTGFYHSGKISIDKNTEGSNDWEHRGYSELSSYGEITDYHEGWSYVLNSTGPKSGHHEGALVRV